MTVSYDAFALSAAGTSTRTWTHTPVGTPRAIVAYVVHDGTADDISGCTYNGVAMTEMTGSPNVLATGEGHVVYAYHLGTSLPTGAQTVEATAISNVGLKLGYSISLQGADDTEVVDTDTSINSTSQADPSATLALGGRTCFCSIGFASGQDAASGITPLTGWTARNEADAGTEVVACYTYDTVDSADVTAGWTQTAEDACAIASAISEVQAAVAIRLRFPPQMFAMGVGGQLGGNRLQ